LGGYGKSPQPFLSSESEQECISHSTPFLSGTSDILKERLWAQLK